MGTYVHLHVCFECRDNDPVASLARDYLGTPLARYSYEGGLFLRALAERSGRNPGPKGGLSLWGIVGNGTDAHDFVHGLEVFWLGLLTLRTRDPEIVSPSTFGRVLVFYERENTWRAGAYEIFLEDPSYRGRGTEPRLGIRHHEALPFAWMQT